jgi:DNA polymerase III subunit chi
MAEVWFYHLERRGVLQELPGLLQRGLERGLKMAVVTNSDDRVREISQALWGIEETAFLAHGFAGEPEPERQPIFLMVDGQAPNQATFCFYVDGAAPASLDGLARAIILFDGNSDGAVQLARQHWKELKPKASAIKYWKQNEEERWQDQAAIT